MSQIIESLEQESLRTDFPKFKSGDTVTKNKISPIKVVKKVRWITFIPGTNFWIDK